MRQYMHFIRLTQEEMKVKTLTVDITREALCDKFLQVLFKDTFTLLTCQQIKAVISLKKTYT